jgi:predicted NAD/FAD-binding protein
MYPNFYRFLELHKRTGDLISNATTFSVSTDGGAFEWGGASLQSLLCRPSSILDLAMWRMVFDIARFCLCAVRVLSEDGEPTIEAYVEREGYSAQFKDKFLVVCTRARPRICGRFGSVVNCYSP